jgi:nicotinate phosphoribosyltransferase
MVEKAKFLHAALCHWSDFGTRRRFSFEVQRKLVEIMREYSGFHGTSNPYLAFMYDVVPIGTYAHEAPMAMQAKYGARMSNRMWNEAWVKEYRGDLGIALTDTLTTPAFLKDFDMMFSKLFDGMRQDSGDPYKIGEEYVKHYHSMRINPKSKRVIFSDSLDCKKGADLNKSFMDWVQPFLGIGTHLTNDVGAKPLNMVIKMISADFGHGMRPVVKLSDNVGKVTGLPEAVEHVKWEMGL